MTCQNHRAQLGNKKNYSDNEHIRIQHECEDEIEKSILRITDWHHKACRVMTNDDHEGLIFLYHPHMNNGVFYLLTSKYPIFYWKDMKRVSR